MIWSFKCSPCLEFSTGWTAVPVSLPLEFFRVGADRHVSEVAVV
jgi:hypothetical protein